MGHTNVALVQQSYTLAISRFIQQGFFLHVERRIGIVYQVEQQLPQARGLAWMQITRTFLQIAALSINFPAPLSTI